jgi:bacterioferritin-associated ferredoxin
MAVTEAEVEAAIAGGATTREAVTRVCRAGGDCGACHGMIDAKIEDHLEDCAAAAAKGCPAHAHAHAPAPASPPLVAAEALVRGRAA